MTDSQQLTFQKIVSKVDMTFMKRLNNLSLTESGLWRIAFYKAKEQYKNVCRELRNKLELM